MAHGLVVEVGAQAKHLESRNKVEAVENPKRLTKLKRWR